MNEISPKLNMLDARLAGENAEMLAREPFGPCASAGEKATRAKLGTLKNIARATEAWNFEIAIGRGGDMAVNREFLKSAYDVGFGHALDTRVCPISKPVIGRGAIETAESVVIYSAIREKLGAKLDGLEPAERIDVLADMFGGDYTAAALLNREIEQTAFNPDPRVRSALIAPTLINALAEQNFRTKRKSAFANLSPTPRAMAIKTLLRENDTCQTPQFVLQC